MPTHLLCRVNSPIDAFSSNGYVYVATMYVGALPPSMVMTMCGTPGPVAPTALLQLGRAVAAVLLVDILGEVAVVGVGGGEHRVQVVPMEDHT